VLTSALTTAAIGAAAVAGFMFILWLIHLAMKNASIVDVGWASSLGILAIIYAVRTPGDPIRAWLIAAMAATWAFRLAIHLLIRIVGKPEEGRYVQLRRDWKTNLGFKFLLFFEFQAVLAVGLSIPFLLPTFNPSPTLHPVELAAVVVFLIGVVGESVADAQLSRFKSDPANKGRTCRVGLWRYSRHPNYFFEWLIWVSFALYALVSPWGWVGLISPALILYFLFNVTGIPATEAQALRSRGDEYRKYQETTPAFFPWFPRRTT
jgi:steroid 5-alpha reductase family enzyme